MQPNASPNEDSSLTPSAAGAARPQYLPVKLCAFGAFPAVFAVIFYLLWHEAAIDRGDLTRVFGRVVSFDTPPMGKYKELGLRLLLEENSGGDSVFYVADQRISPGIAPALQKLRPGDQVTALVRTYGLPSNSALREVRRGPEVLLSYEQTQRALGSEATGTLLFASFATMATLLLVAIGFAVRLSTGSWR